MGRKKKAEQEVYHVEVITRARVSDEGDWEYYVKWAGYESDADSWEPQENVKQCDRLLNSFWKHVGIDDEDYSVGHEIAAQDYWIQGEKDLFAKQFAGEGKRKSKKDDNKRKVKQEKAKTPELTNVQSVADSSEESDVPLVEISAKAKTLGNQGKKRKKILIDSDSASDSSEGRPLKQQRKRRLSSTSRSTVDKEPSNPKTSAEPAGKPSRILPPPPRPSTSSVSSPILPPPPPPKIYPARTHQDQKSNPLVKPMGLPSQAVQSGSALTTKQRIAASSGSSVVTKPKPLQQAHSKLLTGLSFKKKPEAKDTSSPTDRSSHPSMERKSNEKEVSSTSNVQASGSPTAGLPGAMAGPSSATEQIVDEPLFYADPDVVMYDVDDIPPPPRVPPLTPAVQEQVAKLVPPPRTSSISALPPTPAIQEQVAKPVPPRTSSIPVPPRTPVIQEQVVKPVPPRTSSIPAPPRTPVVQEQVVKPVSPPRTSSIPAPPRMPVVQEQVVKPVPPPRTPSIPAPPRTPIVQEQVVKPAPPSRTSSIPAPPRTPIVQEQVVKPVPPSRTSSIPAPPRTPIVQELVAKPVPPKRASEIAADEFLGSLSIPGLNSPLEVTITDSPREIDSFRPKALTTMKASAMPKIPKKWKWEGDLFFDFVQNQAEKICGVTIQDPTDSRDGARMSSMMAQTDTIRIRSLYTVLDLTPVFRACGEVQQFARLAASESQDTQALHGLFRHMSYQRQVTVFPLSLDGAELALLLMFSPSLDGLCSFLRVPDHLRQNSKNTHALVALLPWLVSSAKYNKGATRKPVNETIQRLLLPSSQPKEGRRRILKGTVATMAMDLLAFPPELLDFMSLPNRSYCIWFIAVDGTPANPGLETRQLKYILSKTNAAPVSLDAEARVIFIHVGALESFYNLPSLVTKRRDTSEVRFFTYGTHQSVPSNRWGMREILPLGGIVTFTPMAMAEDPFGCYSLMLQLAQHPLWACYLMPSIVGLSHALACGKAKPSLEVLSMESCLLPILDLVDAGSIAVMQSPRTGEDAWLKDFITMQELERQDLLQECIQSSAARFAHCSEPDVLVAADQEISRDLLHMELQPALMDDYRRFVIIRATSEESRSLPEGGSGLEWSSISKFQFGDDFFPASHNHNG